MLPRVIGGPGACGEITQLLRRPGQVTEAGFQVGALWLIAGALQQTRAAPAIPAYGRFLILAETAVPGCTVVSRR
jgi:hypothetical protein